MFTSAMRRPALALPMLAALLVTLSAPASATTVASTVHYQKWIQLDCPTGGATCDGKFPEPGAKRRLNVTRMSCQMENSTGATAWSAQIALYTPTNKLLLAVGLPFDFSSANGRSQALNQAVDVQVAGSQFLYVRLGVDGGAVLNGICTATGTLDTLQ